MTASTPDRRTTTDRREMERRRSTELQRTGFAVPPASADMVHQPAEWAPSPLESIRRLALAVEALSTRLGENGARNSSGPTCTVDEAAALLGTTAKGIYALYERGKLPRSIGPGRRLVFLREELLQFARRASPSGGRGR